VLDLEEIAIHRGSVIGSIPGKSQPTQKLFDSALLQKLQSFNKQRPIWVEAESKKVGNVQLPEALLTTMRTGTTIQVESDMIQRVKLWREDYRHFEEDPEALLARLEFLVPLVGKMEFDEWEALAKQRQMPLLFERLMRKIENHTGGTSATHINVK
jgi:tRNA 2-selenouridine synthase